MSTLYHDHGIDDPLCIDDAVRKLKIMHLRRLPPLKWRSELAEAAKDHAEDIGPRGICGHKSSDGTSFEKRLKKYGKPCGQIAENISHGKENGREAVLRLFIDEGAPESRIHAKNIINPKLRLCGIYTSENVSFGKSCVIDYSYGYLKKGEKEPLSSSR